MNGTLSPTAVGNIATATAAAAATTDATTTNGGHREGSSPTGTSTDRDACQALCFGREVFTTAHFEVDRFIADCRLRVPLESVLTDLHKFAHLLENELVELINQDYADFVNLSSNLAGLDTVIESLRKPLQKMSRDVTRVRDAIDETVDVVEGKLAQRRMVAGKKATLQLYLNVNKTIGKMENLLHPGGGNGGGGGEGGGGGGDDTTGTTIGKGEGKEELEALLSQSGTVEHNEATSNIIQRVANDFNQLMFYVSKGEGLPFVRAMQPRISAIESTLKLALERLFREGLATGNVDVISNCLRTYSAIDRANEAEDLFSIVAVEPFIERTITRERLNSLAPGMTTVDALSSIYDDIIAFVDSECQLLLDLQRSIRGFDFLADSVWSPVSRALAERIPSLFSPGIPESFHAHYTVTSRLLGRLEAMYRTRDDVLRFREHPATVSFMKRWNLAVYFGIRFQGVLNRIDQSLSALAKDKNNSKQYKSLRGDTASLSELPFLLPTSEAFWECLCECWDKNVFLPPIADRLLGLTLQLVARYRTWLCRGILISKVDEEAAADAAQVTSSSSSSSTRQTADSESAEPSRDESTDEVLYSFDTPAERELTASPTERANSWSTQLPREQRVFVYHDTVVLSSRISSDMYANVIRSVFPPTTSSQAFSIIAEALADAAASLNEPQQALAGSIVGVIASECVVALQSVRSITGRYRMTNMPVPSKPMYYVESVVSPLQTFLKRHSTYLDANTRVLWASRVVERVANRFLEMATELLRNMSKQELLLKKIGRKATSLVTSTGNAMTDSDKILLQLYLDIEEFGRLSGEVGVDIDSHDAFGKLKDCVKEAEKFKGRES